MNVIAQLFHIKRLESRMSQTEISELTGIQQATLSRIENGERFPTQKQTNILCSIYELDSDRVMETIASEKIVRAITQRYAKGR